MDTYVAERSPSSHLIEGHSEMDLSNICKTMISRNNERIDALCSRRYVKDVLLTI